MSLISKKSLPWLVTSILLFCFFLFLNIHTGMVADDFIYSFSRATWGRVTQFWEIFPALQVIRENVNGRVFSHFFAMVFLLHDKMWFNLVNSLASTVLFFILLCYVRSGKLLHDVMSLLFLFCAVWLLLPAYGQVFLWLTGACNYSWTMLLSFTYLLPFYRAYQGQSICLRSRIVQVLYCVLAFLTGGWSENGGLAVLFSAFCFLALVAHKQKRLPLLLTESFAAGLIGFLFLMTAPSELSGRRGSVSASSPMHALLHLIRYYPRMVSLLCILFVFATLIIVVLFFLNKRVLFGIMQAFLLFGVSVIGVLLAIDVYHNSTKVSVFSLLSDCRMMLLLAFGLWATLILYALYRRIRLQILLSALVLGAAAIISITIFFFAAYFPARSSCPFIFYTTLADAILISELAKQKKPKAQSILASLFLVCFVILLPFALTDVIQTHSLLRDRRAYLEELGQLQPGTRAIVTPVTPLTKYPACWPGDEAYFETEMGWYYGLSSVGVTEYVS